MRRRDRGVFLRIGRAKADRRFYKVRPQNLYGGRQHKNSIGTYAHARERTF